MERALRGHVFGGVGQCEQHSTGPDRRILKAFYTQYVSVLLILLTFAVGAYQRGSAGAAPASLPAWTPPKVLMSVAFEELFSEDGTVQDPNGQLRAIAEVVTNHDVEVRAAIRLRRFAIAGGSSSLRRALVRASALERFFERSLVPASALSVLIQAAPDGVEQVTFEIISSEESHG